jgi:hypothetical protein
MPMRGALSGRLSVLAIGMAVFTILSTRNPVHKEKGYLMDKENWVKTLGNFVSKHQKKNHSCKMDLPYIKIENSLCAVYVIKLLWAHEVRHNCVASPLPPI